MHQITIQHSAESKNEIALHESANQDAPLIFIFPALGVRASYYTNLLKNIAQNGFHACVIDWRGNGKSSMRPSRNKNWGYTELLQDMEDVVTLMTQKFPNSKKFLLGHSLGGQLGALFLAKNPMALDGLILVASCSVYYKGWTGFAGTRLYYLSHFFGILANLWGKYPGPKIGFGGVESRGVMHDWGTNARTGQYVLANDHFDYEGALTQVKKPVLALNIKGDTFAPVEATKNLVQKLNADSFVQYELVDSMDDKGRPLTHFNWAKHSDSILVLIKRWSEVV